MFCMCMRVFKAEDGLIPIRHVGALSKRDGDKMVAPLVISISIVLYNILYYLLPISSSVEFNSADEIELLKNCNIFVHRRRRCSVEKKIPSSAAVPHDYYTRLDFH